MLGGKLKYDEYKIALNQICEPLLLFSTLSGVCLGSRRSPVSEHVLVLYSSPSSYSALLKFCKSSKKIECSRIRTRESRELSVYMIQNLSTNVTLLLIFKHLKCTFTFTFIFIYKLNWIKKLFQPVSSIRNPLLCFDALSVLLPLVVSVSLSLSRLG